MYMFFSSKKTSVSISVPFFIHINICIFSSAAKKHCSTSTSMLVTEVSVSMDLTRMYCTVLYRMGGGGGGWCYSGRARIMIKCPCLLPGAHIGSALSGVLSGVL
jgi:hypothetical protein